MSNEPKPEHKSMRVWHIPQIPGKEFYVPVSHLWEARRVLDTLARYDKFQFENNIKGAYANANGLSIYDVGLENPTGDNWTDWEDIQGRTIREIPLEELPHVVWSGVFDAENY